MTSAPFSLTALRGRFSQEFAEWDAAVLEKNTPRAKRARRAIQRVARHGLSEGPAIFGGFYLFHDPGAEGLRGLNYIGIADTPLRPIGRRIEDRLKDDSALDVALDSLSDDEARPIILRRLLCALPMSGNKYVEKHMKVGRLFRCSPFVILIGSDADKPLIRETEKVLIGGAAAAGAPLTNSQHVNFRGSVSEPALKLAHTVIKQATRGGLPENGAVSWMDHLSFAIRFA